MLNEYMFIIPIAISLILGAMSPGPSFLMVAQTAVTKSRAEGVAMAVGTGLGAAIFAILASAGLYVVLENVPWLYTALKIFGGLYLAYIAYKIWRSPALTVVAEENPRAKPGSLPRAFLLGLMTQLSNPKTAIVFASVFAAFLPADIPSYGYAILCLLAFVFDFSWYALVSVLLSTAKAQRAYSKYSVYISKLAGGFLGFMGIKLALS